MGMFGDTFIEKQSRRTAIQGAQGNGPSAARAQLAQGLSQAQGMMSAQAAGVRQNPLAAMRNAQQQGAQMVAQQQMQAAQVRGQEQLQGQQQQLAIAQQDAAQQQALVGGLMSMAGTGLAAATGGVTSDVNAKREIQPGAERTDELLRAISPQQFRYRDEEAHGSGQRLGVMAQDVQRAAPELVDRGPDGNLRLDGPGALSASLAANARLAQRLDALEGRMGGGAPRPAAPPVEHKGKFDEPENVRQRSAALESGAEAASADGARQRDEVQAAQSELRGLPPEVVHARRDAEQWDMQRTLSASRTSPIPPSARRQAHRGPGVDMSSVVATEAAQDELRGLPPEMVRARRDAEQWDMQRTLSASRTSPTRTARSPSPTPAAPAPRYDPRQDMGRR